MRIRKYVPIKNILLIIAASAAFYACSQVPDLSEYQGINYIANHDFTSPEWSFDDTVEGAYHYMGFNTDSAGAAAPPAVAVFTGLPNDADSGDISRLEIFNLVPDGGFETGTAGWDNNGTTTNATFPQNNTDAERVLDDAGNDSLKFTLPAGTDILRFNLSTLDDTFIVGSNYILRLYFTRAVTNDTAVFEYNDGSDLDIISTWKPKTQTGWDDDLASYTRFPDYDSINANITAQAGYFFCIGSFDTNEYKPQNGYIDNFRIVRSDINYYLRMTVPYSESGRPDLYSGIYRFAVYVKGEADADATPAVNRFRSSRVSLVINGKIEGFSSSEFTNTGWTRLTAQKFIQIEKGGTIEIMVSPGDISGLANTLDIGSILIASPSLYYISD